MQIKKLCIIIISLLTAGTSMAAITKQDDIHYMKKIIAIAKTNPKAPFAAAIVRNSDNTLLCTGLNNMQKNPTLHGEIDAINNCAKAHPHINWQDVTLYTTAEPCPMCMSAIVWAKIPRVVYGTSITYLTEHGWSQININAKTVARAAKFYHGKIVGGLLHEQTDKLFTKA